MRATLDTNVLVYASDEASPFHDRAKALLAGWSSGPELVYLFWPVVMGYLRIATHPGIFTTPLGPDEAMANISDVVALPHVRVAGELPGFWGRYCRAAGPVSPRGNLVPDAHLVALMHQHEVSLVWSHDRDLRKFDGITVRDPFVTKPSAP